ncbi:PucR family transcriptional regulator ligand-binding domain-containing protein [Streptomyces sp. NPDC051776]|uniref:PucR family transcriptional regulator n=1 Tax=Streptomyces sp. NPDC051776 TaxID=3155414 RepID=UPI003425C7C1
MSVTLQDVLFLPAFQSGSPEVVAGADRLGQLVQWVHCTDAVDAAQALRGGELLLTTGAGFPERLTALSEYIQGLAIAGACGLVVQLEDTSSPALLQQMARAAQLCRFPLITLHQRVRCTDIAKEVNDLVVEERLELLNASDAVHRTFNELALEGADPSEVVREMARMSQSPVVLENLAHQILACDSAGDSPRELISNWEGRSRQIESNARIAYDEQSGWATAVVGARGSDWGRLLMLLPAQLEENAGGFVDACLLILERGASTLALNRLTMRNLGSLERQMHSSILAALCAHSRTLEDISLRAGALGVPLEGNELVGVVIRQPWLQHRSGPSPALTEYVAAVVRDLHLTALVGDLGDRTVGLLIALDPGDSDEHILNLLSAKLRRPPVPSRTSASEAFPHKDSEELLVAAGPKADGLHDARRSLLEAVKAADTAMHMQKRGRAQRVEPPRTYHRLPDAHLRGLLYLLRNDPRVQAYVEHEIGPLLAYDARHQTHLTEVLASYLNHGCNKTAAAEASCMSRPSFYERLNRIKRILAADLGDPQTRLALQVAIQARETMAR